jgi:hypothetical protein
LVDTAIEKSCKIRRMTQRSISDTDPSATRGAIQVLDRMVSLLDALALESDPASLKDLSGRTGLHPSTAHRILNDLVLARYVERVEPGTYQLGLRLLELGNLVKARLSVRDAALHPMRELHRGTGQPVNLSVRRGDEIVYIVGGVKRFVNQQLETATVVDVQLLEIDIARIIALDDHDLHVGHLSAGRISTVG